jgi:hypothetical protein
VLGLPSPKPGQLPINGDLGNSLIERPVQGFQQGVVEQLLPDMDLVCADRDPAPVVREAPVEVDLPAVVATAMRAWDRPDGAATDRALGEPRQQVRRLAVEVRRAPDQPAALETAWQELAGLLESGVDGVS